MHRFPYQDLNAGVDLRVAMFLLPIQLRNIITISIEGKFNFL